MFLMISRFVFCSDDVRLKSTIFDFVHPFDDIINDIRLRLRFWWNHDLFSFLFIFSFDDMRLKSYFNYIRLRLPFCWYHDLFLLLMILGFVYVSDGIMICSLFWWCKDSFSLMMIWDFDLFLLISGLDILMISDFVHPFGDSRVSFFL